MARPAIPARAHSPQPLPTDAASTSTPSQARVSGAESGEGPEYPLDTPQRYSDGWVKEPKLLCDQWKMGRLFKRLQVARDHEGNIVGKEDGGFVISGHGCEGRLPGLSLMCWDANVSYLAIKMLAKADDVLFVAKSTADVPAWVQKRHPHLFILFEHQQLAGAFIVELACTEFSPDDHYQLLQEKPKVGDISSRLWKQARKNGDRLRQAANSSKLPFSERIAHKLSKPIGEYEADVFQVETMKQHDRLLDLASLGSKEIDRGLSGRGSRKRKLFDDEEALFRLRRVCAINGEKELEEWTQEKLDAMRKKQRTEAIAPSDPLETSHAEGGSAAMQKEGESKTTWTDGWWKGLWGRS